MSEESSIGPEQLANDGRKGTVGLRAHDPATSSRLVAPRLFISRSDAVKERLEKRCREEELLKRGARVRIAWQKEMPRLSEDDLEDLEDAPDEEVEATEERGGRSGLGSADDCRVAGGNYQPENAGTGRPAGASVKRGPDSGMSCPGCCKTRPRCSMPTAIGASSLSLRSIGTR